MRIAFTKMHALGNDFAVFDAPGGQAPLAVGQLRGLSQRHTGIGFDQALVLEPPRRDGTDVFYRIFNADGCEVEQCGNGARCIAALLASRGAARSGALTLDSPAGIIEARVHPGGQVSVNMGPVRFDPATLPFEASGEADHYPLEVDGQMVQIGAVSIGNPHAVLTVESAEAAPVARLGAAIAHHLRFPNQVNVGFMEVCDRAHVRLRVYERGVGETLACGTGACAAVALGRRWGLLEPEVRISARGGELRVRWSGPGESIWLTGPAQFAFQGLIDL